MEALRSDVCHAGRVVLEVAERDPSPDDRMSVPFEPLLGIDRYVEYMTFKHVVYLPRTRKLRWHEAAHCSPAEASSFERVGIQRIRFEVRSAESRLEWEKNRHLDDINTGEYIFLNHNSYALR